MQANSSLHPQRRPLLPSATQRHMSQVRPKNGFLDILAKRNSKLGGALPYQSSSLAREFYLHPDFSGARSTTGTLLSGFLHSTRSLANALHARNNVCT
jgi:hypothetical protein